MDPEKVKEIRRDLRLTQEQLAKHLGVSRGLVAQWELGLSRISTRTAMSLEAVAARLGQPAGMAAFQDCMDKLGDVASATIPALASRLLAASGATADALTRMKDESRIDIDVANEFYRMWSENCLAIVSDLARECASGSDSIIEEYDRAQARFRADLEAKLNMEYVPAIEINPIGNGYVTKRQLVAG